MNTEKLFTIDPAATFKRRYLSPSGLSVGGGSNIKCHKNGTGLVAGGTGP
jgi:hypothetical protein